LALQDPQAPRERTGQIWQGGVCFRRGDVISSTRHFPKNRPGGVDIKGRNDRWVPNEPAAGTSYGAAPRWPVG
jgi:hypothetical protein